MTNALPTRRASDREREIEKISAAASGIQHTVIAQPFQKTEEGFLRVGKGDLRALAARLVLRHVAGNAFLDGLPFCQQRLFRSEEHTSELQSLMRISYAVFCLKKKDITD